MSYLRTGYVAFFVLFLFFLALARVIGGLENGAQCKHPQPCGFA